MSVVLETYGDSQRCAELPPALSIAGETWKPDLQQYKAHEILLAQPISQRERRQLRDNLNGLLVNLTSAAILCNPLTG